MRHLSLIFLLISVFQSARAALGPRRAQWMSGGWGIGFRIDASPQYWEQWDVEATMKQFRAIKGNPGWVIINLSGPAHGGDIYLTHHPVIWALSNGTTAACPPPDDPDKNLFKKLLEAFKAEGFKVIVYMAGQGPGLLKLWHKNTLQHAHDWDGAGSLSLDRWRQYVTENYGDPDAFIDGHQYANMKNAYAKEIVEYYSTMYGTQIDGWWFDQGTYMNRTAVEAACRLGNPDAVVAMNYGQKVPLRVNNPLQEDYTFGHMNPIKRNAPNDTINEPMVTSIEATSDGFITNGVNWDSLGHMFMPMGKSSWNQIYTPLNPLGWTAEGAYDWMTRVRSSGGAWTWNIPRANYMPALGAGTPLEENMSQLRFDFVEFANVVADGFSQSPSESPSMEPTSVPSEGPSGKPSTNPTESIEPSPTPSKQPTLSTFPSLLPTETPSASPKPSSSPSVVPTMSINPTPAPSGAPSWRPSSVPSANPSQMPSLTPTTRPSRAPSAQPSSKPSLLPTGSPSDVPSKQPSDVPSRVPSGAPSSAPSASIHPSSKPSITLSKAPSSSPSLLPSDTPSITLSKTPSSSPSILPSDTPSITLSKQPSSSPSLSPTRTPSLSPSSGPSGRPSLTPSLAPSMGPSHAPSKVASAVPSSAPTHELYSPSPSLVPSGAPSMVPSLMPSSAPSIANSTVPSLAPSGSPSEMPSGGPSESPSLTPSVPPSSIPSGSPSSSPGPTVSNVPSLGPSGSPSQSPTVSSPPSANPTSSASPTQSLLPTMVPSSIPSASLHPTATDSPTEFPSTAPSLVPTLSGMPSVFPTSSMPPSVSAVPSNVPSAIPSTTNVPSLSPTGTLKPSASLVPTVAPSGSVQPSNEPSNSLLDSFTDARLDCSADPCGEVGGDDRWSICYVNPQTKMTSSVCVSTTSIYLNGEGEHYCGECKSECHETLDENDSCDDAHFCTVAVSPTQKERCRWFEDQDPNFTKAHCAFNEHMRTQCPETCGTCVDTCEDDPTQKVDINGIMRPCSYLKARPHLRPEVCFPTSDAWEICQETCGNCEGTLVLSITEDADYDNSLDD